MYLELSYHTLIAHTITYTYNCFFIPLQFNLYQGKYIYYYYNRALKMTQKISKLLSIKAVQDALSCSRSTVLRLIDKGILEDRKIGHSRKVLQHSLEELILNGTDGTENVLEE